MNGRFTLAITTPSPRELCITRVFDAPRALVFDAFTKPQLLSRWLLGPEGWTMPVCEIDLTVGGRYRYVWRHRDGRQMAMGGVYREIVVPERVVATELFDEDWTGGETLSTLQLVEVDGATTMTTTVLYGSQKARDAALATGMKEGLETGYNRLDEILSVAKAGGHARRSA